MKTWLVNHNYGVDSVGDNNGRMLDVTFDDELWLKSTANKQFHM